MHKINIWGVRGSFPSFGPSTRKYGGNTSCVSLETDTDIIVFDAGSGLRQLGDKLIKEGNKKPMRIFVGHFHVDHLLGFFACALFTEADREIHIYGVTEDMKSVVDGLVGPPYWPFGVSELGAQVHFHSMGENEIVSLAGGAITVDSLAVSHPGGCHIYRVRDARYTIIYALDCEVFSNPPIDAEGAGKPTTHHLTEVASASDEEEARELITIPGVDPALLAFMDSADLVFCDAGNLPAERVSHVGWGHSDWQQWEQIIAECNIGRALMMHYGMNHDDNILDAENRQPSRCEFAREGMSFTLEVRHNDFYTPAEQYTFLSKENVERLLDIGIALSSENDSNKLFALILETVMALTNCDAGTIYILEEDGLHFRTMRNNTLGYNQDEDGDEPDLPPVPLNRGSVCALAIIDDQTICIDDVRNCDQYDLSGPINYDSITGYYTKSMLVVPMKSREGVQIGVLQLINAIGEEGGVVPFNPGLVKAVESVASQAAVTVQNIKYTDDIKEMFWSIVRMISNVVDERTPYNLTHTQNMATFGGRFIDYYNQRRELASPPQEPVNKEELLMSIWLHDLGKLVIPLEIMNKNGRLDPREREIMEQHVVFTDKFLAEVSFPKDYAHVREWAADHHEFLNGTGYPNHKTAESLPTEVRIITILDIFDALIADDRPYKPGVSIAEAVSILREMAVLEGKLDRDLVEIFIASECWKEE